MPWRTIPLLSWFLTKWRGSLRLRHTLVLSGMILLIMGLISTVMLSVQRSSLHEGVEAKGLAFTQAFALGGWAAVHGNLFRIQEALVEYSQDPDIRGIEVIDKDNMIVAAQNPQQIGLVLEDRPWLDMKQQKKEVVLYDEGPTGEPLLIIVAPLIGKGQIEAWIRVIFSLDDLRREETQLVLRMTILTLILMAAGILGVQWAQKQVSGLLQKVSNHLQEALAKLKVAGGAPVMEESKGAALPTRENLDRGDIEYLGETVTETVNLLKIQSEALRDSTLLLEQKVMDRTKDLSESKRSLEKEISERRLAQDKLEKISRQNQLILNSAGEGIYGLDLDGHVTFVNPAGAKSLGYQVEELLGRSMLEMAHHRKPDGSPNVQDECGIYSALKDGVVHQIDTEVMWRKDGTSVPVDYTSTPIWEHGKLAGAVVTFRDITERKRAEEAMKQATVTAETANRAKSDFLASMSHELRTPLNGILGYAQILKRDPSLADKQKAGVEVIQRSGDHLLNLINDVLDLSKIEAKKLELQLTEFHLPDFLQQIANLMRVRAEQAELSFEYETVSDIPTGVRGDEKRLRQVILNLLGNAVKFTEKGGVVLKVGYDDSSKDSRLLRFQVEDTGRGIPEDQLGEIFQPFQQVDNPRRPVEGTGLGLSITKQLVALMGGELGVTSVSGQGSTFWFTVDLPVVDTAQVAARPVERTIAGYKGERKRILIVDDKEANRGIIVHLLEPVGFEVREAVNGEECLTKATAHPPDLIIMDLLMPVMDGIEATRRIRQMPDLKDVVILASSASVFEFTQKDSLTAGCNDFLTKPVRADHLFEKLGSHLSLEWVYDSEPSQENTVAAGSPNLIAPPVEEMKALVDLAGKGKINGIRQRIVQIQQMGDEYRPFAAELDRLAESFDMDQLTEFLNPYLEKKE